MSATPDTVLTNLRNLLTCLGCGVKLFDANQSTYRSLPLSSIACSNQRCSLCCVRSVHYCSIHGQSLSQPVAQTVDPITGQSTNQSIVARCDGVFEHGLLISCMTDMGVIMKGMLLFDESMIEIRPINQSSEIGEIGCLAIPQSTTPSIHQSLLQTQIAPMKHIPLFPDALINQSFDMIHQPISQPAGNSANQPTNQSKRRYNKTGAYRGKRKQEFLEAIGETSQSTNQSTNQSQEQSTNQSTQPSSQQ